MKTKITMTIAEAEIRLAASMYNDIPFAENEIQIEIVPLAPLAAELEYHSINKTSKIELIKMVRTLADHIHTNRVKMTVREYGCDEGTSFLGLAEAKAFVENYVRNSTIKG